MRHMYNIGFEKGLYIEYMYINIAFTYGHYIGFT